MDCIKHSVCEYEIKKLNPLTAEFSNNISYMKLGVVAAISSFKLMEKTDTLKM